MTEHDQITGLLRSDLHASVGAPVLQVVNFLNEVIDRFPNAISFAPGAPAPIFFDTLDIVEYIDRYATYLSEVHGLAPSQVRRHMYQYGPARGQICELVASSLYVDEGMTISPQAIVITVGAQEAMLLVLRSLRRDANDVLAAVTPSYVGVVGACRLLDMEIVPIPEGNTGIDLDALSSACQSARAAGKTVRAVYVAPDFANPSGILMDLPTREALLALAERENLLVLEDSTYAFTAEEEQAVPSLKKLDQSRSVIYIGTFSKVCMPGTRVGFVVADQLLLDTDKRRLLADELAALKTMVTINTSPICQAVIGGMLLAHDGSLTQLAKEKAAVYRKNLRLLLEALHHHVQHVESVSWNTPAGGFFVRMRLPVVVDDALLELSAREFGVLWTPMAHFQLGDTVSHELRLSCSYLSPEQIEEGARRLGAFVEHVCRDLVV